MTYCVCSITLRFKPRLTRPPLLARRPRADRARAPRRPTADRRRPHHDITATRVIPGVRRHGVAVAWAALRDFGALHWRLVRGFVTDTRIDGQDRIVTFFNGE
jgi:hypothetical protein